MNKKYNNKTLLKLAAFLFLFGMSHALAATGYAVKADYLYKFAKYVKWSHSGNIEVCVIGPDPFGKSLDKAVSGKWVKKRKLVTKRLTSSAKTSSCHLLFISNKLQKSNVTAILKRSSQQILTISDRSGFIRQGGIVEFFNESNYVRFNISHSKAKKAGLKLRSQLLKLAKKVF